MVDVLNYYKLYKENNHNLITSQVVSCQYLVISQQLNFLQTIPHLRLLKTLPHHPLTHSYSAQTLHSHIYCSYSVCSKLMPSAFTTAGYFLNYLIDRCCSHLRHPHLSLTHLFNEACMDHLFMFILQVTSWLRLSLHCFHPLLHSLPHRYHHSLAPSCLFALFLTIDCPATMRYLAAMWSLAGYRPPHSHLLRHNCSYSHSADFLIVLADFKLEYACFDH